MFYSEAGLEQDAGVAATTIDHRAGGVAVAATLAQDVSGTVFTEAAGAVPVADYGNSFTTVGTAKRTDY